MPDDEPKRRGRPRIHPPKPEGPPRPRGRPPKVAVLEHQAPVVIVADPPPAPPHREEPSKGYTRIYVDAAGETLETPITEATPRPEPPAPRPQEPATVDVALPSDVKQRSLVDQYGELDRLMRLHAADEARYKSMKTAIKSWFAEVPPDADGVIEGDVYRLHLSACERERRIRALSELLEAIGTEKFLEVCTVSIQALEDAIGKTAAAQFIVEERTGSRRIRPVPKFAAQLPPDRIQ